MAQEANLVLHIGSEAFDVSKHEDMNGRCRLTVTYRTASALLGRQGADAELVDERGLHVHRLVIVSAKPVQAFQLATDSDGGGEVVAEIRE